tara:strand:+ start:172 stop:396 length:225 start_codon:yes stop_codon:yes gene_type:complete
MIKLLRRVFTRKEKPIKELLDSLHYRFDNEIQKIDVKDQRRLEEGVEFAFMELDSVSDNFISDKELLLSEEKNA